MHQTRWTPNPDQQKTIEIMDGLCLVIAGPGTGKTETLTAKTEEILRRGGQPLAVTYTRAAASEMLQRLGPAHTAGLDPLQAQATIRTCHSLAFTIFNRSARLQNSSQRLLDSSKHEKEIILRQVIRRLKQQSRYLSPNNGRKREISVQEIEKIVSRAKVLGPKTEEEKEILSLYEEEKGPDRLDFHDLLTNITEFLSSHPEWLHGYQQTYTHVLIDEAHDVDPLQARFLSLFVPPHNALTLFLDPDQAIYTSMGADLNNLLSLFDHISPKTTIELRPTYRSRAPIIHCALSLIRHNPPNGHGRTMTPVREGNLPPRWIRVRDQAGEARLIAKTIHNLIHQSGIPAPEISCLFRANSYRTMLEVELTQNSIPFLLTHGSHERYPTYLEYSILPLTALLLLAVDNNPQPWVEGAALRAYVGKRARDTLTRRGDNPLEKAAATLARQIGGSGGERVERGVHAYLQDIAKLRENRTLPPQVTGKMAQRMIRAQSSGPPDDPSILKSALQALALFSSL
jgi:superfamily I DNA/RNA helicase